MFQQCILYQLDQLHARFRQRVLFEAGRASFLQKSSLPWTGVHDAEVEAYVFTVAFLRSVKTTVNEALLLASNLGLKTNKARLVKGAGIGLVCLVALMMCRCFPDHRLQAMTAVSGEVGQTMM